MSKKEEKKEESDEMPMADMFFVAAAAATVVAAGALAVYQLSSPIKKEVKKLKNFESKFVLFTNSISHVARFLFEVTLGEYIKNWHCCTRAVPSFLVIL